MPDSLFHRMSRTLRRHWRQTASTWATRAESAAVVRLAAAAAAAGVPAATMLDAWAEDSRGGQGTRLEKAARLLRQGATASEALAGVPGLVQDDHAVALAFGTRIGLLEPVMQAALAGDDLLEPTFGNTFRSVVGFLVIPFYMMLALAGFLTLRTGPNLLVILRDLSIPAPASLLLGVTLGRWMLRILWMTLGLVAVAVVIRFSPALRRLLTQPLARSRRIAAALDSLAVAEAGGHPTSEAAAVLAECQVDPRLAKMLRALEQPGPLGSRLAAAGLIAPQEATVIDAAGHDSPAAVERVAAARRARSRRRSAALGEAIMPCFVMAMGLFVLLLSLAVFDSLAEIIHGLG
jgi:type II secretory pathway component PulF